MQLDLIQFYLVCNIQFRASINLINILGSITIRGKKVINKRQTLFAGQYINKYEISPLQIQQQLSAHHLFVIDPQYASQRIAVSDLKRKPLDEHQDSTNLLTKALQKTSAKLNSQSSINNNNQQYKNQQKEKKLTQKKKLKLPQPQKMIQSEQPAKNILPPSSEFPQLSSIPQQSEKNILEEILVTKQINNRDINLIQHQNINQSTEEKRGQNQNLDKLIQQQENSNSDNNQINQFDLGKEAKQQIKQNLPTNQLIIKSKLSFLERKAKHKEQIKLFHQPQEKNNLSHNNQQPYKSILDQFEDEEPIQTNQKTQPATLPVQENQLFEKHTSTNQINNSSQIIVNDNNQSVNEQQDIHSSVISIKSNQESSNITDKQMDPVNLNTRINQFFDKINQEQIFSEEVQQPNQIITQSNKEHKQYEEPLKPQLTNIPLPSQNQQIKCSKLTEQKTDQQLQLPLVQSNKEHKQQEESLKPQPTNIPLLTQNQQIKCFKLTEEKTDQQPQPLLTLGTTGDITQKFIQQKKIIEFLSTPQLPKKQTTPSIILVDDKGIETEMSLKVFNNQDKIKIPYESIEREFNQNNQHVFRIINEINKLTYLYGIQFDEEIKIQVLDQIRLSHQIFNTKQELFQKFPTIAIEQILKLKKIYYGKLVEIFPKPLDKNKYLQANTQFHQTLEEFKTKNPQLQIKQQNVSIPKNDEISNRLMMSYFQYLQVNLPERSPEITVQKPTLEFKRNISNLERNLTIKMAIVQNKYLRKEFFIDTQVWLTILNRFTEKYSIINYNIIQKYNKIGKISIDEVDKEINMYNEILSLADTVDFILEFTEDKIPSEIIEQLLKKDI